MLGYNIFEDADPENTIRNILEMEIPNFSEIREDIDERLNSILHLALQRPRDKRYQTADQMLTELENFIYGDGYGPTNEKSSLGIKRESEGFPCGATAGQHFPHPD